MKKVILLLLVCAMFAGVATAEARSRCRTQTTQEQEDDFNVLGIKIDAPALIKIDKEGKWTLGAEGGKEVMKNLFYDSDDTYVEADKGYFAFVKVTYTGCLLNCNEEKEDEIVEE